MTDEKETFGTRVRRRRTEKKITLRKFADMMSVSPTYISLIERDEFNPPIDDKIREMARLLGEDEDELLALASRLSPDLPAIIHKHPREVAAFLRTAKDFNGEDWKRFTQKASQTTSKKGTTNE